MQVSGIDVMDYGQIAARLDAHRPEVFSRMLRGHLDTQLDRVRQGHLRADSAGGAWRADSLDSLAAARDMEDVLAEILRDEFGPRYSERYVPTGTMGAAAWADTIVQKRVTRSGLLDYVTSADMPWVNVRMQEITHLVKTLGGRFGWSWIEMQRAQFGGVPLRTELAVSLREAAEDTKDMILLEGDAGLPKGAGFIPTGLINDVDVPIAAVGTGGWATATAAQIIADVSGMFVTYRAQSRRIEMGTRLLLPEAQIGRLESLQVPNTSSSVRKWLLDNISELTEILPLPALAGAGAGATDRAMLYAPNPSVLEGVIPMDFNFILEESMKLRVDVYGVLRMIGLVIKKPFACLYMDGI